MNETLEGIVLKQSEYRENDGLVYVLCRDVGKITLVARGMMKDASRNRSVCVPFSCSLFELDYDPNRTMFVLKTGTVKKSYYRIRENLVALSAAQVMGEIVDKIAQPHEPIPLLYDELQFCLDALHQGRSASLVLAYFIAQALKEMGLEPNVDECVACGDQAISTVSISEGGFVCRSCASQIETLPLDLPALKMFRYINKAERQHFEALQKSLTVRMSDVKIFVDFLMLHSGLKLDSWRFFMECTS